jgi:hypothetical protein
MSRGVYRVNPGEEPSLLLVLLLGFGAALVFWLNGCGAPASPPDLSATPPDAGVAVPARGGPSEDDVLGGYLYGLLLG